MTSEVQPSDSWEPKDGYLTPQACNRALVQELFSAIHPRHTGELRTWG